LSFVCRNSGETNLQLLLYWSKVWAKKIVFLPKDISFSIHFHTKFIFPLIFFKFFQLISRAVLQFIKIIPLFSLIYVITEETKIWGHFSSLKKSWWLFLPNDISFFIWFLYMIILMCYISSFSCIIFQVNSVYKAKITTIKEKKKKQSFQQLTFICF